MCHRMILNIALSTLPSIFLTFPVYVYAREHMRGAIDLHRWVSIKKCTCLLSSLWAISHDNNTIVSVLDCCRWILLATDNIDSASMLCIGHNCPPHSTVPSNAQPFNLNFPVYWCTRSFIAIHCPLRDDTSLTPLSNTVPSLSYTVSSLQPPHPLCPIHYSLSYTPSPLRYPAVDCRPLLYICLFTDGQNHDCESMYLVLRRVKVWG